MYYNHENTIQQKACEIITQGGGERVIDRKRAIEEAKAVLDFLRPKGYCICEVREILQYAKDGLAYELLGEKKTCPEGQAGGEG